jgi:hypothetical protein
VGGAYGVRTVGAVGGYDTDPRLTALSADVGTLSPGFDRDLASYTLTVPESASSVALTLAPARPYGYVKVDGVVVDDTVPRTVAFTGESQTVQVEAFAEDHVASTSYTLTLARETAGPPVVVTLGKPRLEGFPRVGQALTLSYAVAPQDAEVRVQWYRVGCEVGCPKVISAGNDRASYTLADADLAAGKIQVKVTVVGHDGRPAVVKYSDLVSVTAAVPDPPAEPPRVKTATATVVGGVVSLAYVTDPAGYDRSGVTVRWYDTDGARLVGSATGLESWTPPAPGSYQAKITLVGSTVARYSNIVVVAG